MPKPTPRVLFSAAARYLKSHPDEVARAVRGALGLRFGVPLDALRFLVRELVVGKKAPRDVVIEAAPPGLRLGATVVTMGSTLRVGLTLFVEELWLDDSQARIAARIADLGLEVVDGHDTPLAGLVKSGALDLSKPGNLVAFMPKRPAMLVEAKDDRVAIDLLKAPKLASNETFRRLLRVVTPVISVAAIRTRDDHLDVHLKATAGGIGRALSAARSGA
jgi:hypothetical protein